MHDTDKYSKHSLIIRPVWLNGCVFVYQASSCGFESRCSHLGARFKVLALISIDQIATGSGC